MPKDWGEKPSCAPREKFEDQYLGSWEVPRPPHLEAYTDGACRLSNPGLCSCAFVVFEDGFERHSAARVLSGLNTNNFAEYSGLLDLMFWAAQQNVTRLTIYSDSKLVVEQVNGRWKVSDQLLDLRNRAYVLLLRGGHKLVHVKGHNGNAGNERVDALCNHVLDEFQKKET